MRIYLAAGLKTENQRRRNVDLAYLLSGHDKRIDMYLPQDYMILDPDATQTDRTRVFNENIRAIRDSNVMVAILDDDDKGTIWEMGYAVGIVKPVIGYYTNPHQPINVMLTQGCMTVCRGKEELLQYLANTLPISQYMGQTE